MFDADPVREHHDTAAWNRALGAADFVACVAASQNETTAHADVILPAEADAEKEGTVTHPDGRLQRLRPGVPHPGSVRHGWQWLCELAAALGHDTGLGSAPDVLGAIAKDVPFYAGLTLEEIGGRGVRWQERGQRRCRAEGSAV